MGHFLHCFWIESWCLEHFSCTSRIAFPTPTEKLGKTWAQRAWEPFLLGFMFIINLLAYFPCCLKKKYIFLTRLICCLVSEKKTARWGARKRREAVIDCLLVCDLFHMKHTWHSCQRFLFAPFLVSFTLLITLLISDAIKCFTVCALAQGSGGVARVALYQGKHAACLTTHITLLLCHYNSAPLKLEHLGTLTTPPPALCSPAYKKSVLLVAKTNPISQWHLCILLNLMHVLQFSLQFTQWLFFPHLLPDTCY